MTSMRIVRQFRPSFRIKPVFHSVTISHSFHTIMTSYYSFSPPIPRVPAETISQQLLSPPQAAKLAIIDVRGDDHVGGHIRSSINAPSDTLDWRIPELVRTLADKEVVVFHCALSQERGPRAARAYMEEKIKKGEKEATAGKGAKGLETEGSEKKEEEESKSQKVYVLDLGFVGWQRL